MAGVPPNRGPKQVADTPRLVLQARLQALKEKLARPREKEFIPLAPSISSEFRLHCEDLEQWLRAATHAELERVGSRLTVKEAALNPLEVPPYIGMQLPRTFTLCN
jgi:hypothetical protein